MKWLVSLLLLITVFLNASASNPEENRGSRNPNLLEGDMILSNQQIRRAEKEEDVDRSRKRAAMKSKLWPNGVVPYMIDSSLSRNSRAVSAIRAGIQEWSSKTCIRFKKKARESAYIRFKSGSGCASYVGRTGRQQDIFLASGCWYKGVVAHEIGHAIGFFHEQSRPDRDSFITVFYGNIRPGAERNFHKYPRSTIDSLGTRYDYGSLMHYRSTAFSKNGRPTIVPKRSGVTIGQRLGLSSIDAQQANLLYKAQCALRPGVTCKDKTRSCRYWSWRRRCRWSKYVKANCRKTCKLC
ncbi:zinc metalloproteinase nas-15-like isoform X1 [Orbicella faveolata]|uniref:zinc metalloproteinase nas-15-like isoform X1 n=1 Tax=Orbicella faveolata TaxID=48498 RepID=UPI0009E403F5|nr:zinc metalloproteinase nas-15-like isoform X1 [Orbicella faveolata]